MARFYSEHNLIESDIAGIYKFIATENPAAALSVVRAIDRALREIRMISLGGQLRCHIGIT